jgi:perosamine synthetase
MFALTVSNGSVALHLGLVSLGIGSGDEVIVPNITFAATINAVIHAGATPVLCEINKETLCIDPKEIELLITSKTKAIMPVHLYGQACDMEAILTLADKFNLKIIEDCAEAIGSSWKNKYVGSFGDISTFSFFGNKTISTGEGGMIVFKDEDVYKHAKTLRDHGMNPNKKYWHDNVGYNFRLTNIQSAIGVAQMEQLDQIIEKKIYILKFYKDRLIQNSNIRYLPQTSKNSVNSNWLFTLLLQPEIDRDNVISGLLNFGIDCRPIFYPLHQMEPYKNFKKSSDLTASVSISYSGISLPSSVSITDDEMIYVIEKLSLILSARSEHNIVKN